MDLRASRPKGFLGDKKKMHTKTLSAVYLFRKEERIPKELRNIIKYFFLFQFWVLVSHNNASPWRASWRCCEYGEKMGQKDRLHLWCTVRVFIPGTRFAVEEAVAPPVPAHTQCGSTRTVVFLHATFLRCPNAEFCGGPRRCWTGIIWIRGPWLLAEVQIHLDKRFEVLCKCLPRD